MKNVNDIDTYIAGFPEHTRNLLELLRATIIKAAPGGDEVISYNMPAYKLNGILVWYAGYKNHVGLYPTPKPIEFFMEALTEYKTSKGAIQFPLNKPLPITLITKIVEMRATDMRHKSKTKKK